MAGALQSSFSICNPRPTPRPSLNGATATLGRSHLSTSCASRFHARRIRSSAIVPPLPPPTQTSIGGGRLQNRQIVLGRRFPVHVTFAAPQEDSKHRDGESGKDELQIETNESLEAWKQMLESFKEEAIKMQNISQEAYVIYSKRATVVLKEASENVKIQADQARHDLSKLAEVISEEGQEYLSTAAEKSPESMKDIVETFASSRDDLKNVSDVRDFYLGIPYGAFLVIGGFLNFMVTGRLSGIRFGVILGGTLLALSVSSLRAWRSGRLSTLFLKGQAAITAILFIREWKLLFMNPSFPSFFMTLISGAMLVFYVYRMMVDGQNKGSSLDQTPEN